MQSIISLIEIPQSRQSEASDKTRALIKARQEHLKGYQESCLGLQQIQTDAKLARVEKAEKELAALKASVDSKLEKVQEIFASIEVKITNYSQIGKGQE